MSLPINDTLNIRVQNNTNLPQNVNILGGTQDPLSVPPNKNYQWDLSTETYFGSVVATIVISNTSNPTPVTYSVQVNGYNIQAIVFALNSLNKGIFQFYGNIIYVSNDFYIYGVLTVGSTIFTSTWDTTLISVGSSANNQIQLPLESSGTYNFLVDWGDGNSDVITTWNQPETLHTYTVAGTYTLKITGDLIGFRFNVLGDVEKILSITSWGTLSLGNSGFYFAGCTNLDLSSLTDVLNLTNTTNLTGAFFKCSNLTLINRINEWDVSGVTRMSSMFRESNFNDNISSWNVINVIRMDRMFDNATLFNQNIGSWNVLNTNVMGNMFFNATAFNQDISSWNISNVTSFGGFMASKTDLDYLAVYLDAIYNKWSLLSVQPNLTIDFGTIKYTIAGQAGKNILLGAPQNWNIIDGGI